MASSAITVDFYEIHFVQSRFALLQMWKFLFFKIINKPDLTYKSASLNFFEVTYNAVHINACAIKKNTEWHREHATWEFRAVGFTVKYSVKKWHQSNPLSSFLLPGVNIHFITGKFLDEYPNKANHSRSLAQYIRPSNKKSILYYAS